MQATGNDNARPGQLKRLMLPLLLAGSLMIGACGSPTTTAEPDVENTVAVQATEPLATEAATEAATLAPTTAPVDTAEPATQQPAATLEGTPAEGVGTQGAGETAMPATVEELLVQSSNLIGMDIQGFNGLSLGTVRDVLVNETGDIQYIVVELPAIAGGEAQNV